MILSWNRSLEGSDATDGDQSHRVLPEAPYAMNYLSCEPFRIAERKPDAVNSPEEEQRSKACALPDEHRIPEDGELWNQYYW
jgi:hypothetical protein